MSRRAHYIEYTTTTKLSLKESQSISISYLETHIDKTITSDGYIRELKCVSCHSREDYEWEKTSERADPKKWEYNEALKKVVEYLKSYKEY